MITRGLVRFNRHPVRRLLAGPRADVAVGVGLETLDDVALVGEAGAEEMDQEGVGRVAGSRDCCIHRVVSVGGERRRRLAPGRHPPPRFRPASSVGPKTFVERVGDDALASFAAAGDFASVDPDESAVHGRIVAVRAGGPGSAMLVRLMVVENGRSGPRAANLGRAGMEVTRANEAMIRTVVVFVGRAV